MNHAVSPARIKKYLGDPREAARIIPTLKKSCYFVDNSIGSIAGEAPKDFIRVFESNRSACSKTNRSSWIPYIAKVGMKHYPNESITEKLICDLGHWCGFEMANSKLYNVKGQVRFCSEYFLNRGERLVHGAEIYSRYLDSAEFVKSVEAQKKEPEFFDFEFALSALKHMFPTVCRVLERKLVLMLLFDAIVGNNDRHMYNWGVVIDVKSNECLRFAPIYDSARGLFWNTPESGLSKYWAGSKPEVSLIQLEKYAKAAKPRIGKSTLQTCDHFELIEHLHRLSAYRGYSFIAEHFKSIHFSPILKKVEINYNPLLPEARLKTIIELLRYRYNRLSDILV